MTSPNCELTAQDGSLIPAIALLTLTICTLCGFLLYQAVGERHALMAAKAAQDQPLLQTEQVKGQLASWATATAKLAEQGNSGAKHGIEGMQREGITVKP